MPGRGGPTAEGLELADDDLINLLHQTGRAAQAFTAEVHEWLDGDFVTRAFGQGRGFLPPALDGLLGPDAVWDAVASRAQTTHKVMRLRLAPPGRYRIDRLAGRSPADPEITGCDGEHQWLVRGTKMTFWDALPLPRELGRLADPAWLLAGFTLRAGGETEVGGRRGQLLRADRRTGRAGPAGGLRPRLRQTGPKQAATALWTPAIWASAGSTIRRAGWRWSSIRTWPSCSGRRASPAVGQ